MCVGIARIGGHIRHSGRCTIGSPETSGIEPHCRPIVDFDSKSARFDGVNVTYERAGDPVEVVSPHGQHPIWTRKTPVHVTGTIDGLDIDSHGLVDESAGHHARVTQWQWSAGCGTSDTGAAVTWNLVDGVHDSPLNSERTIWINGVPQEIGPVEFAPDLTRVDKFEFPRRGPRQARHDRMIVIDSKYRQPFGTFPDRWLASRCAKDG